MEACACDLCGSDAKRMFPAYMTGEPTVALCTECGLIYTSPRYSREEIDAFYASEFDADPGAAAFTTEAAARLEQVDFEQSLEQLRDTMLPTVLKYVQPEGKKWLELRFRTGAALSLFGGLGAEVWGVDLFEANVRSARQRIGVDRFFAASVFDLLGPVNEQFDVVSALSIHVLAHAPSPSRLLADIYDHLTDDGILLIEDKDVQEIPPDATIYPLAYPNPIAHYHHMTLSSARAFVERAGFDILHADFFERTSALGHFMIVARKSPAKRAAVSTSAAPRADDPEQLYATMVKRFEEMEGRLKVSA